MKRPIAYTVPLVVALLLAGCAGGRWGTKYELLIPLSDDLREMKGIYESRYYVTNSPIVEYTRLWDRLTKREEAFKPKATDVVVLDPCSKGRLVARLVRGKGVLSEATIACRRLGKRVRFDEHWSWWGIPGILFSYSSGYKELGVDSAGNLHYLEFTDFAGGVLFLMNGGSPRSFEVYARAKTNACFQADGDTLPAKRIDGTAPAAGEYLVIDLSAGPFAPSYPVSYLIAVPAGGWTDEYKTVKLVMRRIPAGTFTMGSPLRELGRWNKSENQRQVTLNKDFYIGVFEVTQKQWERVMGYWPSHFANTTFRESRPLEYRSWNDIRGGTWPGGQPAAGTFMQQIRDRTGLTFDLPTEAQWEYACRAGTGTALNSGKNLTDTGGCEEMSWVGRYSENGGKGYREGDNTGLGTATVGSYLPNAWGLYDMHGNVQEWCLDWYTVSPPGTTDPVGADSGSSRVLRGGSWSDNAWRCRSASRNGSSSDRRYHHEGFRLFMTLP